MQLATIEEWKGKFYDTFTMYVGCRRFESGRRYETCLLVVLAI